MNPVIIRSDQLEGAFERLLLRMQQLEREVIALENKIQLLQGQGGSYGSAGTTTVWEIPGGLAISAGSSATADVYKLVSGTSTLAASSATIYNTYGAATTAGKALTVGANGDGTFTVIGQSC